MPRQPKSNDAQHAVFWQSYREWLAGLLQATYDQLGSWQEVSRWLGRSYHQIHRDIVYLRSHGLEIRANPIQARPGRTKNRATT